MQRVALLRLLVVLVPVAALEAMCRAGLINHMTLPPPSEIVVNLFHLLASGKMDGAIAKTFTNVAVALISSLLAGTLAGVLIHKVPLLRATLDPLFATYYAIPIYAFYPLMIVVFGLGDAPQVLIGFMLAVVSVVVSTLNGLDSVPKVMLKAARIHRLSMAEVTMRITLPYALPHLFTGVKLAVAYAFIGVIGAEFIMSQTGLGYEIRFSFDSFDNTVMYPLILLILVVATVLNLGLDRWEKALMVRRGRR